MIIAALAIPSLRERLIVSPNEKLTDDEERARGNRIEACG
jgi:hypothetical protein